MSDSSLIKYLGLPENYKQNDESLFSLAMLFNKLVSSKSPVSKISLIYYKESKGEFLNAKRGEKRIVKDIFNNLSKEDQFDLLRYWS